MEKDGSIQTMRRTISKKAGTEHQNNLLAQTLFTLFAHLLTHSLIRLVKPTFPIELNRKQKHFQSNGIIVENYYCIANTSVITKLHVLKICKLWFFNFYITYRRDPEVMRKIIPHN